MSPQGIYTVGGTVQPKNSFYIKRTADKKLLELFQIRSFSYVLSSRQVGKSSLMAQTALKLREDNHECVIIDLNKFGVKLSAEEWYLGLLKEIQDQLYLDTDVLEWWENHLQFG